MNSGSILYEFGSIEIHICKVVSDKIYLYLDKNVRWKGGRGVSNYLRKICTFLILNYDIIAKSMSNGNLAVSLKNADHHN